MNLFDDLIASSTSRFLGNQTAKPSVPSFSVPQAPKTASYTAPAVKAKPIPEPIIDETKTPLFQAIQGGANLFTGISTRLKETAGEDQATFEKQIKQKQLDFTKSMLQKGYPKETIFKALDKLKEQGEFDYKPGVAARIVESAANRMGEAQKTTERLANEPLATRLATGIPSYAGDVVGAVTDIPGAVLSPVVQKVIETTGQKENVQELSKGWEDFKATNPNLADAIEGIVNVGSLAPIGAVKPVAGAIEEGAMSVAKTAPKLLKKTQNIITKTPEAIGKGVGSTVEYGTSLATGLSKESQQIIRKNPELYKQARLGDITSEGELGNFAKATEARLSDLSELGKGYDTIKKGSKVANSDEIDNIYLERTREIPTTRLTKADKTVLKDASDYISQLQGDLTDADILALRQQLDSISYDPNTSMKRKLSPQGARLVEGMRADIDNLAKGRIPGLKELDEQYAPEVRLLKDIKKNIYDANGNLKDNALSTISNIVNKNKDLKLAKFEEIYPDLGARLRALKAYEEVGSIASMKTGSILRQLGGAAAGTAVLPGFGTIAGFIATNPHIVARILEAYGMVTSKANAIVSKGKQITPEEAMMVKKAVQKVPKSKVENIINNLKFNPKTEELTSKTLKPKKLKKVKK